MNRIIARTLLAGCLLFSTESAVADVAPSPDYEETCTRARVEEGDEYCASVDASYGDLTGCVEDTLDGISNPACGDSEATDSEACCQAWLDAGWTHRCDTYGASVYSSIWCRARREGDPERPAVPDSGSESSGCSTRSSSGSSSVALALLALCAGVVSRRRKRR